MKKSNTKEKRINIRVSNDEYAILKAKAKEADVSISTFLREIGLKGRVTHLDNGKEIARQIGTLHGKIEMYHQDIVNKIEKIQKTLDDSNQLLKNSCDSNYQEVAELFNYQKLNINFILGTILHANEEHEKNLDSKLKQVISFVGG